MPVSSLKWTRAVVLRFFAAALMSFAVSRSVTGRVTPASTIGSISSGRMEERIWTGLSALRVLSTFLSSSASKGSATPKPAQSVVASAAA